MTEEENQRLINTVAAAECLLPGPSIVDLEMAIHKNQLKCIFCSYTTMVLEQLKAHSCNCPEHPAVQACTEVVRYLGNVLLALQWVRPAIDARYAKAVLDQLDTIYRNGLKFILPPIESCRARTFNF